MVEIMKSNAYALREIRIAFLLSKKNGEQLMMIHKNHGDPMTRNYIKEKIRALLETPSPYMEPHIKAGVVLVECSSFAISERNKTVIRAKKMIREGVDLEKEFPDFDG